MRVIFQLTFQLTFQQSISSILAIGWILSVAASSLAAVGDTSIATWKDNYTGAISLTIDDSKIDRLDTLAILDDFGVKGTFYLDTVALQASQAMLDGFLAASANGHEIGSHTLTHADLTRRPNDVLEAEVRDSKQFLESYSGKPVISLAYPFGADNGRVRAAAMRHYIAARDVVPFTIHPATGQDLYRLGETSGPFGWSDAAFIQQRMQVAANTVAVGGWSVDMYHTLVEVGQSNGELTHTEAALRGYLESLTTSDLSLWIAPLGEVAQYYRSREGVQLSTLVTAEQELTVELMLEDPEGTIAAPLTLTTSLPVAWGSIGVRQDGVALPFSVNIEGTDQLITYNALPNGGDVVFSAIPEPPSIMLASLAFLSSYLAPRRRLFSRYRRLCNPLAC